MKDEKTTARVPKPTDWFRWLEALEDCLDKDMWGYITDPTNDATTDEDFFVKKAKFPRFVDARGTSDAPTTVREREIYMFLANDYKARCDEYDRQEELNTKMNNFLEQSLEQYVYEDIRRLNPREKFVAVKARLGPDNDRIADLIRHEWDSLKERNDRDVERWFFEWRATYARAKKFNVDLGGEDTLIRTMNEAVKTYVPELYLKNRESLKEWRVPLVQKTFDQFATEIKERMMFQEEIDKLNEKREKTSTLKRAREKDDSSTKPVPGECVCGRKHWYRDCFYLNPSKRPTNWKENAEVRRKIEARLKEDSTLKAKVKKAMEFVKGKGSEPMPTSFAFMTTLGDTNADRIVLDSGSNIHITSFMNRIDPETYKPLAHPTEVQTGSGRIKIAGYGTMVFQAKGTDGFLKAISIHNTAYSPEFCGSVVSTYLLKQRGYYVDFFNDHIVEVKDNGRIKTPILHFVHAHGQPVIDAAPMASTLKANLSTNEQKQIFQLWHDRLGHPSAKTVEKFSGTVRPADFVCQACDLGKATRKISDEPRQRAIVPFERIHLDIVQMELVRQTKEQYFAHFTCDMTRMHFISIMAQKSQVTEALINIVKHIEFQYNAKVKVLHTDNETSLGKEFNAWALDRGMLIEFSAPRCPEQNGTAERAGGVITMKARTMVTHAGLPTYLWPHAVTTAVYLLNRLPTRTLDGMSPLQCCNTWKRLSSTNQLPIEVETLVAETTDLDKPTLKHLKAFGCEAIVTDLEIPKSHKMKPRAYVGYLIGYSSTNIFKVWIPSKHKVASVRDVIFHENRFFSDRQKVETLDEPNDNPEPTQEDSDTEERDEILDHIYTPNDKAHTGGVRTSMPGLAVKTNPRNRKRPARFCHYMSVLDPSLICFAAYVSESRRKKLVQQVTDQPPPRHWGEVGTHPESRSYRQAADTEIKTLIDKNTFEEVDLPEGKLTLPLKWVFTKKGQADAVQYKARVVVRGDLEPGDDQATYAATLAARLFRMIIAFATANDLELRQLDAVAAFLNSPLEEEIHVQCPPGFKKGNRVWKLNKALYGLRRSPRLWYETLNKTLLGLGFVLLEPCFYKLDAILLVVYVDDILIAYPRQSTEQVEQMIIAVGKAFDLKDMGEPKKYIGVYINRDRKLRTTWLSQQPYVEKLIKKFTVSTDSFPSTPIQEILRKEEAHVQHGRVREYQRKIGSLLYLAVVTRPDIAFAVGHLSEFAHQPTPTHFLALNSLLQHVGGTKTRSLQYSHRDLDWSMATDAAFADDLDNRRSSQGIMFNYKGMIVDWRSKKQPSVANSTTDAELSAANEGAKDLMYWIRIVRHLGEEILNTQICDNLQTVRFVNGDPNTLTTKLRHIDVVRHWLKERAASQEIKFIWCAGGKMPADGFTKPLGEQAFMNFVRHLNLVDRPEIHDESVSDSDDAE